MCGRYWIDDEMERELRAEFPFADDSLKSDPELENSSAGTSIRDICPSQKTLTIENRKGQLALSPVRWGFPPHDGRMIINARSESVFEKKMFRNGIRRDRIVIPAAGFYEWNRRKEKYRFWRAGQPIMYLAAIADRFESERRFVILTTAANESMRCVHDRMPLILKRKELRDWVMDEQAARQILSEIPPELDCRGEYEQLTIF